MSAGHPATARIASKGPRSHTIDSMWPKAFAQLVELAPHISRLLPMADRFFQSKSATEDVTRRTVESLAETLRGDLGQIAAAQNALSGQIEKIGLQVTASADDVRGARAAAETAASRTGELESRLNELTTRLGGLATTLGGLETRLDRASDRVRMGPVVPLLVLTNLILIACAIALLLHRH